ncbi:hypothetical protein SCUCBS95973_003368 [Sporothrix curviconia]|uniref:VWFA domain-containing protein n=1 Tax=Sporothrix curviconia TaxID=1260050 RepID=A0ABP0BEQ8_9PEZI
MVRVPFFASSKDDAPKQEQALPIRLKPTEPVSVAIHRLPTEDGVIIKVTPPTAPDFFAEDAAQATSGAAGSSGPPRHVPCDIVLVIDVSGSMAEAAPVPTVEGEAAEENGLSVLDLVKHASRTILETLNEGDRLGIVTFATGVSILQELTPMTPTNKTKTNTMIESMDPEDSTNLWQGMLTGIGLFKDKEQSGRVPAIMVLTDGMPNFMSPAQGYIPKMRTIGPIPAPIHTFGFGYHLRSGLLKSISEFTGGNYAFIPDAGMIGTVFVHAVANMQSTFANNACLRLTYPDSLTIEQTQGATVGLQKPVSNGQQQELTVAVGNIQYGQSRDIYLRYKIGVDAGSHVLLNADLEFSHMTPDVYRAATWCNLADGLPSKEEGDDAAVLTMLDNPPLPSAEAAFHVSRSMLCSFLASIFPLDGTDEHQNPVFMDSTGSTQLTELIKTLPAASAENASDAQCAALMVDINGQVRLALSKAEYYNRWGKHYLPSLQGAHAVQQCNSFKDPGPLTYATASPLFIACRNALDTAFDTLPPPKPSKKLASRRPTARVGRYGPVTPRQFSISMASYHNSRGPCFASFCRVTLADGRHIRVNRLRGGMRVQTPRGPRTVAAVMKTPVSSIPMVTIGRLLITAWHPVSHNGSKWVFPCRDPAANKNAAVRYTGSIYSVLLQPDEEADSHAINIEGIWVVTLGHGLTEKDDRDVANDVRVHRFFGDYSAVCRSMATLDLRKDGLVVNGGSARSNFRLWHTRK